MANWSDLKAAVAEVIKTNGNNEITGQILQDTLSSIISNVGANATLVGEATPTTNPGAPDGNVFYFATQAGTYTNFGSVVLNEGLNILLWNGTSWAVTNVMNIVQELGTSENAVMSQKAVTNSVDNILYYTDLSWEIGAFDGAGGDSINPHPESIRSQFFRRRCLIINYDSENFNCVINYKINGSRKNTISNTVIPLKKWYSEDNIFKISLSRKDGTVITNIETFLQECKFEIISEYSFDKFDEIQPYLNLSWEIGSFDGVGNDAANNSCIRSNFFYSRQGLIISSFNRDDYRLTLNYQPISAGDRLNENDAFKHIPYSSYDNRFRINIRRRDGREIIDINEFIRDANLRLIFGNKEDIVNIDLLGYYQDFNPISKAGDLIYSLSTNRLLYKKTESIYEELELNYDSIYIYQSDIYKYDGEKLVKLSKEITSFEEINSELETGSINGAGENGVTTDNYIRSKKLIEPGLYLVIFSDDVNCQLNTHESYTIDRKNFEFPCNFSVKVEENDFIRLCFKSKNGEKITVENNPEIVNSIKTYRVCSKSEDYDITLAASDSYAYDRQRADVALNGTNDNDILACVFNSFTNIKVLLYGGNYQLTKFFNYSDTAKVSLPICAITVGAGTSWRRYINICGYTRCSIQTEKAVTFQVTEALHNSIVNDSGINYFIIGCPYNYGEQIQRASTSINFKNFNIQGYCYDKAVTYLDSTRTLSVMLDTIMVHGWVKNRFEYANFDEFPNIECCGIRVGRGNEYGVQNFVKHCNVWYCGKGIACNGEHFIFEDDKTHHNYVGWYFGDKDTAGAFQHPNIMIGCSIEGCYRTMILSEKGDTEEDDVAINEIGQNTLICIGLSTELVWGGLTEEAVGKQHSLGIKEIKRGLYRGRIEMDGIVGQINNHFLFEPDGSGKGFQYKIYNTGSVQSYGTTEERPNASWVIPGTVYFDTTLNKPIFAVSGLGGTSYKWVDANGTIV